LFSGKLSIVTPTLKDPIQNAPPTEAPEDASSDAAAAPREVGGREGPEPTRFGDWELRGRCIDF
jgi:hypothetical protein